MFWKEFRKFPFSKSIHNPVKCQKKYRQVDWLYQSKYWNYYCSFIWHHFSRGNIIISNNLASPAHRDFRIQNHFIFEYEYLSFYLHHSTGITRWPVHLLTHTCNCRFNVKSLYHTFFFNSSWKQFICIRYVKDTFSSVKGQSIIHFYHESNWL